LRAGKTQAAGGVLGGGDLIVAVDGKAITAPADIATAIADNKPGDAVTISYYRGRAKRTVTLTLANRPAKAPSASLTPGGP
jgi:S1-C subfamily serine protease